MANLNLKVGGKYENGFGAVIAITQAPTDKCRWFRDDMDTCYHATGEAVQVRGNRAEYNLETAIGEPQS